MHKQCIFPFHCKPPAGRPKANSDIHSAIYWLASITPPILILVYLTTTARLLCVNKEIYYYSEPLDYICGNPMNFAVY